jgi:hypothetical protein
VGAEGAAAEKEKQGEAGYREEDWTERYDEERGTKSENYDGSENYGRQS